MLGCYFATKAPANFNTVDLKTLRRFTEVAEIEMELALQPPARATARCSSTSRDEAGRRRRWEKTTAGRVLFNAIVPKELGYKNVDMKKKALSELVFESYRKAGLAATVQFLDRLKEFGFANATRGGVSIGIEDLEIPTAKAGVARGSRGARRAVPARLPDRQHHERRALQQSHRHLDARELRHRRRDGQDDARVEGQGFNPVFMMFDSGSRGSRDQIRQLAGMRGLMAKPQKKLTGGIGEIIESPIKSNFREGLSPLEYFTSTHGARKGLADTALKTADAGYLTRRLVDVAQDVTITEEDCGTIQGLEVVRAEGRRGCDRAARPSASSATSPPRTSRIRTSSTSRAAARCSSRRVS